MQDLTHPVADGMPTAPGDPPVAVTPVAAIDADGYRLAELRCGTHTGTHVDAPAHTEPDGATLDTFDVDRFAMAATVVDCRDLGAREPVPPDRVPRADTDCAVFHTGWDEAWGTDRYRDHPYLAPATARRCAERSLDVALDAASPDPSSPPRVEAGEPAGYPAHHAILGAGGLVVENLTGLGPLPNRFELRVFPLALGGDGAPVRAVGVAPTT